MEQFYFISVSLALLLSARKLTVDNEGVYCKRMFVLLDRGRG